MRAFVTGCAFVALAACQPKIPDSAAGVGFDNAVLSPQTQTTPTTTALPPASAVSEETLTSSAQTTTKSTTTQPLATTATAAPPPKPAAKATTTTTVATAPKPTSVATDEPPSPTRTTADTAQTTPDGVVHASPANPAPVLLNTSGISDENNFSAVGSRRTIEDDAALLADNRANYQIITPTALPERTNTGPNVVAFALSTTHAVGTKAYSRMGLTTKSRHEKACAKYATDGDAQSAFLSKGGPKKDRMGLDPDGDGYACSWDPTPFRRAASN